jgi:type I site-specific restriction-modification system R (restriction) subunit
MESLNLPPFDHKVKSLNGKAYIYDLIRRKYVVLTPEEWVRQHFIHLLITHYDYPKSLFSIENGLVYNKLSKRTDIVVLSNEGTPFLLIECKAPHVSISEATFAQIGRYNFTLRPTYLAVTNGMNHFCFCIKEGQLTYLEDFPNFRDTINI